MEKVQIIDLSVPIQQTSPGSPLKVDIEYIDHKQGAKVFGPFSDSKVVIFLMVIFQRSRS